MIKINDLLVLSWSHEDLFLYIFITHICISMFRIVSGFKGRKKTADKSHTSFIFSTKTTCLYNYKKKDSKKIK